MIIRVDKCNTFGIKKCSTNYIQYLPKLLIKNILIPTIKIGERVCYLGRYFDFIMSDKQHKSDIIDSITYLITDIDQKPLHPKNKIALYRNHALTKTSWHFTVANLFKTWVIENLDSITNSYICNG